MNAPGAPEGATRAPVGEHNTFWATLKTCQVVQLATKCERTDQIIQIALKMMYTTPSAKVYAAGNEKYVRGLTMPATGHACGWRRGGRWIAKAPRTATEESIVPSPPCKPLPKCHPRPWMADLCRLHKVLLRLGSGEPLWLPGRQSRQDSVRPVLCAATTPHLLSIGKSWGVCSNKGGNNVSERREGQHGYWDRVLPMRRVDYRQDCRFQSVLLPVTYLLSHTARRSRPRASHLSCTQGSACQPWP